MYPSTVLFCAFLIFTVNGNHVQYLSDQYIEELNQLGLPWNAGRNFPSHLTQDDITQMLGPVPHEGIPESPKSEERRNSFNQLTGTIPNDFDARQYFKNCSSIIGVTQDQGACASSYAFAITSVASDRLCIHSSGKIQRILSAEYVTSCCKICRYPYKDICTSGLSSSTWVFIHKRGLVTGGGYKSNIGCQPISFPNCNHTPNKSSLPSCDRLPIPSPKCHTRCTNEKYGKDFFQDKNKFKKFYWLDEKVPAIQSEIIINGPVVGNMYIYTDFLNYKSGVYSVSANAHVIAYASVKIIGWGEEKGIPYWLVMSTFGDQFGDKGLFKILRGKNEAIIESLVNAAVPRGIYNYGELSNNAEIDSENYQDEEENEYYEK